MGEDAPFKFTRKDINILMRGMTPEIPSIVDEHVVRLEILSVIHTEYDFEFHDASGKKY